MLPVKQCLTRVLTGTYFADLGIIVIPPSISLTCVVLAVVAGGWDCSQLAASPLQSATNTVIVISEATHITSEMHFNAFSASYSPPQPCILYLMRCSMIQAPYQALQITLSMDICTRDQLFQGWIPNMAAHD